MRGRTCPVLYRARLVLFLFAALSCFFGIGMRPALAQSGDAICAEVKIVIAQRLSLERQAFEAQMHINNSLAGQSLEDVHIALQFFDANNNAIAATDDPNAANARFFWRTDRSDGISSLNGGVINPQSAAHIQWLIIPAAGAGGSQSQGAIYYIGAKVRYRLGGQDIEVDVAPEAIIVRPLPQLVLDYFLPKDVAGDDPFTPEIEPSEPFTLGVRIRNDGGGTSHNTRIDTAQPQIVENRQGLAVNFQILSGFVGDEAAGKSLLLDFGDIAPGAAQTGRWNMAASLAGQFVAFNATFTHADALGGALTSLIRQVNTHELIHDVLVQLPGRDTVRDFLAKDGDTWRVYESDGSDTAVAERSAGAQLRAGTAGAARLTFTPPPAATPAYVRVPDPWQGSRQAARVVRSDGHVLPAANAWFSRTRNDRQGWDWWFHIFDAASSGDYTLETADIAAQANLRGEVFEDRNGNGLREAGEPGLAAQEVKLRGTRAADGQTILASAHTNSLGEFHFDTLAPGIYALSVGPAQGLVDGAALAGTAGGQILPGPSASITRIALAGGAAASGYTFAKRTASASAAGAQAPSADLSITATDWIDRHARRCGNTAAECTHPADPVYPDRAARCQSAPRSTRRMPVRYKCVCVMRKGRRCPATRWTSSCRKPQAAPQPVLRQTARRLPVPARFRY